MDKIKHFIVSATLCSVFVLCVFATKLLANDSFMYFEMTKVTNGSYEYKLPAVEISLTKTPFLCDIEFGEIYTAPRSSMSRLNHGLIYFNPNVGFQSGNFFGTISIGGRYYIAQNDWGIPEGFELFNTVRGGFKF